MARKPTRREQLFSEAVERERAATRKINRIRNRNGTRIAGTQFDPRTNDHTLLQTMNGRELRSHIRKLNTFISRNTQFVGALGGQPIPAAKWKEYQRLEKAFNAKVAQREGQLNDIVLPGQSGTIGSRNQLMQPNNPRLANSAFRTFQQINRNPSFLKDATALDTLIAQMKDKNSRGYMKKSLNARLNSARALLRGSQMEEFIPEIEKMSLDQLDVLLNYSTFGDIASDRFASGTDEETTRDDLDREYELRNGVDSRLADNRDDMARVIEWAKSVKLKPDSTGWEKWTTSPKDGWTNPPKNPWRRK